MINEFMKFVYTKIHESLGDKNTDFIKKKAQSLGICNKQFYYKERLIFLISQHIAHNIDLHVQQSKQSFKDITSCNINSILKKRNQMLDQNNNRNHSIEFVKATFLHHYICGPFDIFKSVKLIEDIQTQLLSQYQLQEFTLEAFKQNQQIKQIANQRQFSCICKYQENQQLARCEKCMKKFHPQCQYQKFVCNRCFLSHYFFPIDSAFFSKFGQKRKTQTFFHSKFRCFNPNDKKKSQLFAIKFDIDNFQEMQNAPEPQFYIKIMNFKSLQSNQEKSQKWKGLNSKSNDYSIYLDFNRFEFFLNFFQLRKKNLFFRNENSLIFKLENRMPKCKDNILIIKCDPHFCQDQTYQIGIYRISKIKNLKLNGLQQETQNEMINDQQNDQPNKSVRITSYQFVLMQKYFKGKDKKLIKIEIPNVKKHEEEDDNQYLNQKLSSYQLVRSYGCNHKQGFDFAQLKRNHLKFMQTSRQAHRNKDLKIQVQKLLERQLFKQYKKHAMRMNIKTQQDLPFNQQHLQSIKRYCITNDLLQFVDIPELQNFQKNLVDNQIKKYIGRYQIKNSINKNSGKKNRKQANQKQDKKFRKFAKCPICQNFLSVLYLLPYDKKQGEQMKISKAYRTLKNKKNKPSKQQAQQSLLQMFRPKSIFRFNSHKKEEESQSDQSEQEDDNQIEEQFEQMQQKNEKEIINPKILLSDQNHKQVFQESQRCHRIYITKNRESSFQLNKRFDYQIKDQKLQFASQFRDSKSQQIESEQYGKQLAKKGNPYDEFKVMSEEQSQNYISQEEQKILQQDIIKISDSQSLEQLSFDSPFVNCQEINLKPISKQKKQKNSPQLEEIKQQNQKFIIEEKKQFFQISDLKSQQLSIIQQKQIYQHSQLTNPFSRVIYCKKSSPEQKRQAIINPNELPKQIIHISLLSSDEQQEGQMRISEQKIF